VGLWVGAWACATTLPRLGEHSLSILVVTRDAALSAPRTTTHTHLAHDPHAPSHSCTFCDFSSRREYITWEHVNSAHLCVLPYACEACAFKTANRRDLAHHMGSHHPKGVHFCQVGRWNPSPQPCSSALHMFQFCRMHTKVRCEERDEPTLVPATKPVTPVRPPVTPAP
jgi:hypothetical protein